MAFTAKDARNLTSASRNEVSDKEYMQADLHFVAVITREAKAGSSSVWIRTDGYLQSTVERLIAALSQNGFTVQPTELPGQYGVGLRISW